MNIRVEWARRGSGTRVNIPNTHPAAIATPIAVSARVAQACPGRIMLRILEMARERYARQFPITWPQLSQAATANCDLLDCWPFIHFTNYHTLLCLITLHALLTQSAQQLLP